MSRGISERCAGTKSARPSVDRLPDVGAREERPVPERTRVPRVHVVGTAEGQEVRHLDPFQLAGARHHRPHQLLRVAAPGMDPDVVPGPDDLHGFGGGGHAPAVVFGPVHGRVPEARAAKGRSNARARDSRTQRPRRTYVPRRRSAARLQRAVEPGPRHFEQVREESVGEGEGGRPRGRGGKVRNAEVHDPVHLVGRGREGGGAGGLEAPAHVDGEVQDHAARAHGAEHLPGDQDRRALAVARHRAQDHVREGEGLLDVGPRGQHRRHAPRRLRHLAQGHHVLVEQGDRGAEAEGGAGRGSPGDARAQDHEAGRGHAGCAAEQDALPSGVAQEQVRGHGDGQAARDLRHAGEDGRVAGVVFDGLQADGRDPALEQRTQVLGPRGG